MLQEKKLKTLRLRQNKSRQGVGVDVALRGRAAAATGRLKAVRGGTQQRETGERRENRTVCFREREIKRQRQRAASRWL